MDNEETLKELLEITKENNVMLRKLYKGYVIGKIFSILYWIIIIGLGIGAFYYVQPYIDTLNDTYKMIMGDHSTSTSAFGIEFLKKFVK